VILNNKKCIQAAAERVAAEGGGAAAWISFFLLIKIVLPPGTCCPTKLQATRLHFVRTVRKTSTSGTEQRVPGANGSKLFYGCVEIVLDIRCGICPLQGLSRFVPATPKTHLYEHGAA
jgi:hypothetical protein